MTPLSSPGHRTAVISANSAWNIVNFRGPLVAALVSAGWKVVALAPADQSVGQLRTMGVEFVPIAIDSSGTSVFRDLRLARDYFRLLRKIRPQVFLGFTVKPNVYGSLAAASLGIRTINNISGLGTAFLQPGPLNWVVRQLYRLSLKRSHRIFFQNRHDCELFMEEGLARDDQARVIPGSGIDLQHFQSAEKTEGPFRFLFVGRLLRDKGLVEYAEAARLLRPAWPDVEFAILGFAGSDNRSAVPLSTVERWVSENLVTYLGETSDVRPFLASSDCVVLPSYREGLPRSLLEAAAMGKPMVATDVPGCRDVLVDGESGFLCEARSPSSLAAAMERMLELRTEERLAMGRRARNFVERKFDQSLVVDAYLEALA